MSGPPSTWFLMLARHLSFCACSAVPTNDRQDVADADPLQDAIYRTGDVIHSLDGGILNPTMAVCNASPNCLDQEFRSGSKDKPVRIVSWETGLECADSQTLSVPLRKPSRIRSVSSVGAASSSVTSYWASEVDDAYLVNISDEIDLYNPMSQQLSVVKMADVHDDVLHQREAKILGNRRISGGAVSSSSSAVPESAGASDSTFSDDGGFSESGSDIGSDIEQEGRKFWIVDRENSRFDAENVTNWGMLVGKLLRRRVHGISRLVTRAVHKQRSRMRRQISTESTASQQYVLPSVTAKAQCVVEQMSVLARQIELELHEQIDQKDSLWMIGALLPTLFGDDVVDTLLLLANTTRKIVASQPVIVEAKAPCRVFGDIHGQFRDMLLLFHAFGMPTERKGVSFVFNGDFVDRGVHSLAVVGLLFALKVLMPEMIWLVRGNHEDRAMNERYGFEEECYETLGHEGGAKAHELINRVFDELPLACLISEKIFVVHGGLGEGKFTLNEVREVERPLRDGELSSDSVVWNMLWSDPIEDDETDHQAVFGVHISPRASTGIFKFGWNVTKTFCALNGLGLVIRSHQCKQDGLGFSVMHDNMLIRVFSARDYEDHGNDGAVMLVTRDDSADIESAERMNRLLVRPQIVRASAKY